MKFIFLIIVTIIQLAFQLVGLLVANPSYAQKNTSSLTITDQVEKDESIKDIKTYRKQNEK